MTNWLNTTPLQPLQRNEVHVWFFPLSLTSPCINRFLPLLDAEEKDRSERFVHFIHRKRFIVAHGFMRSVLERYTQQPADTLRFEKGEHGKPCLLHNPDLHFNLSHSQDVAMLAVANVPVGMDVEYVDRKNDWQKIMQRFYTPSEQSKILALPWHLQQRAFFLVWTRKEAHMKVTGKGLYLSPGQFTVSAPPEAAALLALDSGQDVKQWQMFDIELPAIAEDYCACLSVVGTNNQVSKFLFN